MGRSRAKSQAVRPGALLVSPCPYKPALLLCRGLHCSWPSVRREAVHSTELKTVIVLTALCNKKYRELFPKTVLELWFDHADSWCFKSHWY